MELRKDIRVETITLTDQFGDQWSAYGVFEHDNMKPTFIARPRRTLHDPRLNPDGFVIQDGDVPWDR